MALRSGRTHPVLGRAASTDQFLVGIDDGQLPPAAVTALVGVPGSSWGRAGTASDPQRLPAPRRPGIRPVWGHACRSTQAKPLACSQEGWRGCSCRGCWRRSPAPQHPAHFDYILCANNSIHNGGYCLQRCTGKSFFGRIVKVVDTQTNEEVAIQIMKSKQSFLLQAQTQIGAVGSLHRTRPGRPAQCRPALVDLFLSEPPPSRHWRQHCSGQHTWRGRSTPVGNAWDAGESRTSKRRVS